MAFRVEQCKDGLCNVWDGGALRFIGTSENCQEFCDEVEPVARVLGKPVTRNELCAAFELVEDKKNWKNPIKTTLALDPAKSCLVAVAVEFFTGSKPSFTWLSDGTVQVEARGYYLTCGA